MAALTVMLDSLFCAHALRYNIIYPLRSNVAGSFPHVVGRLSSCEIFKVLWLRSVVCVFPWLGYMVSYIAFNVYNESMVIVLQNCYIEFNGENSYTAQNVIECHIKMLYIV